MPLPFLFPTRRRLLGDLAAASAVGLPPVVLSASDRSDAVRPVKVNIPESALIDLRQRLVSTRWPEKETGSDDSQGVRLATLQPLVRYWAWD